MRLWELFLIAVGLSMDAFAVSVCKGLSVREAKGWQALSVGLYFGGFQGLMPLLGYLLGSSFAGLINSVDHWVAFVLLAFIGGNMIRESLSHEEEKVDASFAPKTMLLLAVATSIDALAVGVTFALEEVNIALAAPLIGGITFVLSPIGYRVGNVFGSRYKSKAELLGGVVLVAIGLKILLEGLGILP